MSRNNPFDRDEYPEVRVEHDRDPDVVFEDDFGRRARELLPTPNASSGVAIVPARTGPWSGYNGLGIERGFAADENNLQTILRLNEWGFPEVWTLALGLNDFSFDDNPNDIAFDVTALIEFGSGGVMQNVEIDWVNGASISLPMNAVNVIARYATLSSEGSTSIPSDLRLRCSLVRGRNGNACPTRTIITEEGDEEVRIPPFAKAVHVAASLSLPGISPFQFYSNGSYVQFQAKPGVTPITGPAYLTSQMTSFIDFTNSLVGGPMWLPIPPVARYLQYLNAAGNAQAFPTGTSVIFQIGL